MADVELSGRELVAFIDAVADLVTWVNTKVPWWDIVKRYRRDPGMPQFDVEMGLVRRLLTVKAALDFESDEYTGATYPGWPPDLDRDVWATVRELRALVRDDLRWDLSRFDVEALRRKASQRAAELEEAKALADPDES